MLCALVTSVLENVSFSEVCVSRGGFCTTETEEGVAK